MAIVPIDVMRAEERPRSRRDVRKQGKEERRSRTSEDATGRVGSSGRLRVSTDRALDDARIQPQAA